jgi:hypothetical protein
MAFFSHHHENLNSYTLFTVWHSFTIPLFSKSCAHTFYNVIYFHLCQTHHNSFMILLLVISQQVMNRDGSVNTVTSIKLDDQGSVPSRVPDQLSQISSGTKLPCWMGTRKHIRWRQWSSKTLTTYQNPASNLHRVDLWLQSSRCSWHYV